MIRRQPRFWRDPLFFTALAAATVFWLALHLAVGTSPDFGWPLREPATFLWPALLWPVAEELVFRGLVQDFARRRIGERWLGPLSYANLATSLLFTGLHFFNHPPLWAAAVLLPSLVFGFFKDRTGALTAPVLLHVFYNSGYFWLFGV